MIKQKMSNAFNGLREAYRRDTSFRLASSLSTLLVILFGYVLWPLRAWEFLSLLLAFSLIIIIELLNSALERALERLHPSRHELIGISKDMASAATFTAIIFAVIVVIVISLTRFGVMSNL